MPAPSKIEQLPRVARDMIDQRLREMNFSGFVELAAEFKGFGKGITKSSLHRHAKKLKRRLERAQTEADILEAMGTTAAWLVQWARRYPREAASLADRLRAKEEKEQAALAGGGR